MYDKQRVEDLLRQPRTKESINELIKLNEGLLYKQLSKFYMLEDPDAISLGFEALYNAVITYEYDKRAAFSTYASVCVYNRLGSYLRSLKTSQASEPLLYEMSIGENTRLVDVLESKETADMPLAIKSIHIAIGECYFQLTNPIHKNIISLWVSSEFTLSQVDMAKKLGCSQAYVSTVVKTFKNKLGAKLL